VELFTSTLKDGLEHDASEPKEGSGEGKPKRVVERGLPDRHILSADILFFGFLGGFKRLGCFGRLFHKTSQITCASINLVIFTYYIFLLTLGGMLGCVFKKSLLKNIRYQILFRIVL
jgi:hypothetical protein